MKRVFLIASIVLISFVGYVVGQSVAQTIEFASGKSAELSETAVSTTNTSGANYLPIVMAEGTEPPTLSPVDDPTATPTPTSTATATTIPPTATATFANPSPTPHTQQSHRVVPLGLVSLETATQCHTRIGTEAARMQGLGWKFLTNCAMLILDCF